MALFDKIVIIGAGLIGSSLARAIRRDREVTAKLVLVDGSDEVCRKAVELQLADEITDDAQGAVTGADLVILATPVGTFAQIAQKIGPSLRAGAILSDVGSVKQCVFDDVAPFVPESVSLLPAHPIAGTENSGPEAGFATLFEDHWCIITPPEDADLRQIEKLTRFWESCGARIELMEARQHDLVLAITSHLPHLLAYTIMDTAAGMEENITTGVIKYSAGGFRGFTRIAASDPVMWRDIFLQNKEAVLETLQLFTDDLTALKKSIRRGDGFYIEEVFSRSRKIRRRMDGQNTIKSDKNID